MGDVTHVFKDVNKLKNYLKTVHMLVGICLLIQVMIIVTATTSDNTINMLTTPQMNTAESNKIVVFISMWYIEY